MQSSVVSRLESLSVADVMAGEVCCVSRNDTLEEAAKIFIHYGISAAPVIDERGFCVGIISATDFLRRNYAEEGSESLVMPLGEDDPCGHLRGLADLRSANDYVCRYMTRCLQTVSQQDSLLQAANIMDNQHIHRLPVLDSFGHPIGIISTMDVVSALLKSLHEAKC